jgi:3-oxoacyl-[acyl-carrier protein] reductase
VLRAILMRNDQEFNARVALVTGAARGIGLGIATCLAERGATVVLNDLRAEDLAAAVGSLEDLEVPLLPIAGDVSRGEDVASLVEAALTAFGRIDVLVNNAAVLGAKPFVDCSEQDWDSVIDTNLKGVFLCTRAVLGHMLKRGSGSIVNIASIAAFHYTTAHVAYAASKAGIVALTRDLAYEVAPHGVRVNAVAPGPIATPMTQQEAPSTLRAALIDSVRVGRWGTPRDIGEAVVFLASDRSSFVVGQTLVVAGGVDLSVVPGEAAPGADESEEHSSFS